MVYWHDLYINAARDEYQFYHSLAPHAADRAAENQDRRKWAEWLKVIENEAEKGHVTALTAFDRNEYFTYVQKDRVLDKYPEDFTDGEEPTWWVMGSSKTEPPQNSERRQQSSSSRPQHRQQTAGGSHPQQGATSGRASADDPNKIDNEIIDSIFRMNSGGDDDRWEIGDITSGYETYTSLEGGVTLGGATVIVKFTINANTGYPMVQTVFGEGRDVLGMHVEKPDVVIIALRREVKG